MSGNFVVYLIGYGIAIAGVAYALSAAGVGEQWIIAAVLILIGLGIVYALSRSQQDKDTGRSADNARQRSVNEPSHNPGPGSSSYSNTRNP